jgi:GntR family transcriptional regulator/MocR family aminotransferase
VADFIAEGHFLRHLRRMKRLYAARREAVFEALRAVAPPGCAVRLGGLAVLLDLPAGTDDIDIAGRAVLKGLNPVPLSPWRLENPRPGLMLGITNAPVERARDLCVRLASLIA